MRISDYGKEWIRERESLRLNAYQDAVGVWTIGYGHIRTARAGLKITATEAEALLDRDLELYEQAVTEHCTGVLKQCEFDALVSFAFNCGVGAVDPGVCTAVRKLNAGDLRNFARNFVRWDKGGGAYIEGLAMRRAEELYQFMGGRR